MTSTPAPVDLEGLTKHIDGFEKAGRFDVVLSTDTAKALLSEIERLERIADAVRLVVNDEAGFDHLQEVWNQEEPRGE